MTDAAKRLKARSRKVLTLPASGVEVTIRKLDQLEYIRRGGSLMAAFEGDGEEPTDGKQADSLALLLELCLETPSLWTGAPAACPDDAVTLVDVADDLAFLIREVLDFNTLTSEAAATARKFRDDVRRALGPDLETLPRLADSDSAAERLGADASAAHLPDSDGRGGQEA